MADNKAEALKEASSLNTKLKVYYNGESPADSGSFMVDTNILDDKHYPWMIKWYTESGICHQYANTKSIYDSLTKQIKPILDAAIVNSKQREALDELVDNMLWKLLREDLTHDSDIVI